MTVLITGINGQLGHDAARVLRERGHMVYGCGRGADGGPLYRQLDITDGAAVDALLDELRPDAVLHCAAWTAVDAAEDHEAECRAVNVTGTGNLARACRRTDAKLMYISTDYVFPGDGEEPWKPEDTRFGPLNVYGQSKLDGEREAAAAEKLFIVRIAWVFGIHGGNFVKTMRRVCSTHDTVRVVADQIGTPTYTADLAPLLADMLESEKYGIYHATNEGGYISWYEFTKEICRQAGLDTRVVPVTTEEYGLSRALRPKNSRLDKSKLAERGFTPLPPWQDALARFLAELKETEDKA